jgi:ribosomal protein S18 acetylase RimI-like enzyme
MLLITGLSLESLHDDNARLAEDARQHTETPDAIDPSQVWTITFVHRQGHPSAEIWFFSSLELTHGSCSHEKEPQAAEVRPDGMTLSFSDTVRRHAILQLADTLARVPITSRQPGTGPLEQVKMYGSPICLAGNVHSTVAALLAEAGLIAGAGLPYGHYGFAATQNQPLSQPNGSSDELPEGLMWSTILESDYMDVIAVNKFVRNAATIAALPSAAIRTVARKENGDPGKAIAFCFASRDGAVRTLHVDYEYRRKGLAKAVARRLLNSGFFNPPAKGPFAADESVRNEVEMPYPSAFASIEKSNIASVRTFYGLGAKWRWDAYWLLIDLDKARK